MDADISAIYVRVSTEEQGDRNLSIPAQVAACRRFAGERGWEAGEVYSDVASGKTDQRADFRRLMDDARRGLFQAVVVHIYSCCVSRSGCSRAEGDPCRRSSAGKLPPRAWRPSDEDGVP